MPNSDLKITSTTILKPAPTAIIANNEVKLTEIVLVMINIIS